MVTNQDLQNSIPAWQFWYKLILLFVGNDAPKYTDYDNGDLLTLFFVLYDPLSTKILGADKKWEMIQMLTEPVQARNG